MVGEFHRAFGITEPEHPIIPEQEVVDLRIDLLLEEVREVLAEVGVDLDWWNPRRVPREDINLTSLAKELADVLVVTYGFGRQFGLDMDAVFAEVHRSNMSKLGDDGKPVLRSDGKVLKGPNYAPADIAGVLERQFADTIVAGAV